MAPPRFISGLVITLLIWTLPSCNKSDSTVPPPLANSYTGTLSFEFSRGFPEVSVVTKMDVSIEKNRQVTFGPGESKSFDQEDTLYSVSDTSPVTRVRMTGTVHLIEARGAWFTQNEQDYLLILRHATVEGRMIIWGWDELSGWVQQTDESFTYEDTYDDGETQFTISEAVLDGSSISVGIPDAQGISTYSYTLNLTVGLK